MTVTLPGRELDTPKRARAYVTDFLREWNVSRDAVEMLTLAVSELATNAVTHVGHGTIAVRVTLTDDEALVSVTDGGLCGRPSARTGTGPDDEHGRGLALVEALVDRLVVRLYQETTEVLVAVALPGPVHDSSEGGADDDGARPHQ
ncbi:ATP-binding protein [Streptomyces fractus]|uniref:ATP-binding protein n=1 Tax=Streptomyces fractus TaxID=641806 RepID=UPI003CF8D64B